MRKRRYLKSFVSALAVVLLLTGCGSSDSTTVMENMVMSSGASKDSATESYEESGYWMNGAADMEMPSESETVGNSSTQVQDPLADRKLIKTVNMSVETKEFDQLMSTLETRVAQLGGYIENLDTYNGSAYSSYRNSRDASMTIRIPQDQLSVFLEEVSGISNVLRRSENVQDVTLSYVDLESHKKVLQAEHDRLVELIEQAEYLENILTIEERLTEVQYQLESMESQLRTYDNKINYSTIYLDISEVMELTPVVEETMLQRITGGFMESLQEIGDGLLEFVIWFIVNIPYFILWIVIIAVIILIIKGLKKIFKSGKKKRAQKNGMMPMQQPDNNEPQK